MRVRDWVVALSVAAVLGVLAGGVYSGVTGWTGPGGRASATTGSPGAGLPGPGEQPDRAVSSAPADTGRAAPVRAAEAAEPAKGKAKPAKAAKKAKKADPAAAAEPAKRAVRKPGKRG